MKTAKVSEALLQSSIDGRGDVMESNEPKLPWDADRWNRAYRGAFKRGILAHRNGLPIESCPYDDKRKPDGKLSWSRAFIAAWRDGWEWLKRGKAWEQKGQDDQPE